MSCLVRSVFAFLLPLVCLAVGAGELQAQSVRSPYKAGEPASPKAPGEIPFTDDVLIGLAVAYLILGYAAMPLNKAYPALVRAVFPLHLALGGVTGWASKPGRIVAVLKWGLISGFLFVAGAGVLTPIIIGIYFIFQSSSGEERS